MSASKESRPCIHWGWWPTDCHLVICVCQPLRNPWSLNESNYPTRCECWDLFYDLESDQRGIEIGSILQRDLQLRLHLSECHPHVQLRLHLVSEEARLMITELCAIEIASLQRDKAKAYKSQVKWFMIIINKIKLWWLMIWKVIREEDWDRLHLTEELTIEIASVCMSFPKKRG